MNGLKTLLLVSFLLLGPKAHATLTANDRKFIKHATALALNFEKNGEDFEREILADQSAKDHLRILLSADLSEIEGDTHLPRSFLTVLSEVVQLPKVSPGEAKARIQGRLADLPLTAFSPLRRLRENGNGINIAKMPAKMQALYHNVLGSYFDRLAPHEKRGIILALAQLGEESSDRQMDVKVLSTILQNCGPSIQKLFQLFAKDAKSDFLRDAMADLKTNIRPFSEEEAWRVLPPQLKAAGIRLERVLGSATIGQVFEARGPDRGSERFALKVKRPEIDDISAREIGTLRSIVASDPQQMAVVETIEESIREELHFGHEAENLKEGSFIYHMPSLGVRSISLYDKGIPTSFSSSHVAMSLGRGEGLNHYQKRLEEHLKKYEENLQLLSDPKNALKNQKQYESAYVKTKNLMRENEDHVKDLNALNLAFMALLQRWFENAIFGNGGFHADLHSGNLMVSEGAKGGKEVTLLDYGNMGRFTTKEKNGMKELLYSLHKKSEGGVMGALRELGVTMKDEDKKAIQAGITGIFSQDQAEGDRGTSIKKDHLAKIVDLLLEHNCTLPGNFLNFNRGKLFLEQQVGFINTALRSLVSGPYGRHLSGEYTFRDQKVDNPKLISPPKIYREVFKKNYGKSLIYYFDPKSKYGCVQNHEAVIEKLAVDIDTVADSMRRLEERGRFQLQASEDEGKKIKEEHSELQKRKARLEKEKAALEKQVADIAKRERENLIPLDQVIIP